MRLPRDMSGEELAGLLRRRFGYRLVRQRGSHMRMELSIGDLSHSVTVPRHRAVHVGTLNGIVAAVAAHLDLTPDDVRARLFQR